MRKGFFAVLFLAFCPLIAAQQAMNNSTVIKMVKAGLSDDVIITTINASAGTYDTSPDALIALKQAGVSDKVISAVVAKATASAPTPAAPSAPASPAPAAALPPGVDQVGAYYKDSGGNWQPLPSEVVIFESAGAVKHIATAGLVKEDVNGVIGGMRSRLVVTAPVTLILHVPQGRSVNDYELFRLRVVGNNRQFLSVAGGLNKETAGALRDEVDFTSKQIGPSAYQIVLGSEIGQGEFGFLEPQDTASHGTPPSSGKIYTFAIVE
jgi:hypothetical protein